MPGPIPYPPGPPRPYPRQGRVPGRSTGDEESAAVEPPDEASVDGRDSAEGAVIGAVRTSAEVGGVAGDCAWAATAANASVTPNARASAEDRIENGNAFTGTSLPGGRIDARRVPPPDVARARTLRGPIGRDELSSQSAPLSRRLSLISYATRLLARSRFLFVSLMKVMLPVMIAVQLAQHWGWIDALGHAIAPAMAWLALPPEAGLVWITGAFVGIYGAIAAMIGLATQLDFTAGQLSALCAMLLFAHALPVEQSIVRRAGASFWATGALRVAVALAYGGAVAWLSRLTGVMDEPVSLAWMQASAPVGDENGLWAWAQSTALSLVVTFAILVALLVLLDGFERIGVTRRVTRALTPLLRFSGLDARAAPVTTVGVLLGLTYGGALIIEESEKQQFDERTRFLALAWLSLSHALIEDTVLLLAIGANLWIVLVGRVAVTLVLIAALARLLGAPESKAPVAGIPAAS